jgi:hypothetical protein
VTHDRTREARGMNSESCFEVSVRRNNMNLYHFSAAVIDQKSSMSESKNKSINWVVFAIEYFFYSPKIVIVLNIWMLLPFCGNQDSNKDQKYFLKLPLLKTPFFYLSTRPPSLPARSGGFGLHYLRDED